MFSKERAADQAHSIALGAAYNAVVAEATKATTPAISRTAVRLEPRYAPFDPSTTYRPGRPPQQAVPTRAPETWHVQQVRLPVTERIDWPCFDALLASLATFPGTASFELWAEHGQVTILVGAETEERVALVKSAWQAALPGLVLLDTTDPFTSLITANGLYVLDLFPDGPYYRRLSAKPTVSPQYSFFQLARSLERDEAACWQVLFSPVRGDWQRNAKALLHAETLLGARAPFGKTLASQTKDMRRPWFATRWRLGLHTNRNRASALRGVAGAVQFDGKPLRNRNEREFRGVLRERQWQRMLPHRVTYTVGMLLASDELATLVHLPDKTAASIISLDWATGLPVPPRLRQPGRPLGVNEAAGAPITVSLPDADKNKCCYLIGASRKGKSTAIQHHIRYLAAQGHGVGLIDPHRTTAQELLRQLDKDVAERVVFLDFDDPEFVVAYNPFAEGDAESWGRLAVEFTNSCKHLFEATSYHRMTHILGRALYALFVLRENLASIPALFAKTPDGERLRRRVAERAPNAEIRRFWRDEFRTYSYEAFAPILNRLSALFLDDQTYRLCATTTNTVRIDQFMNDGKILIVALPSSVDTAALLGGMLIAQFQKAALARTGTPDAEREFFLFVDEFHRFTTGRIIESIVNETVKGGLHVGLAHQETGQLTDELLRAVLSIPNIFVFNVNLADARKLVGLFNGQVTVEDILSQRVGEVIARLDSDIVNFRSPPPPRQRDDALAQQIIAASRDQYCIPRNQQTRRARRPRRFDTL